MNDNKIAFTSMQKLSKLVLNKKIVLFGAGIIADKTLRVISEECNYIVDNSSNLWGKLYLDIPIFSPEKLLSDEDFLVIICTSLFSDVCEQLSSMGFLPEENYVVSPVLNDVCEAIDLDNISRNLLFTSGRPVEDNPKYGGGIYELNLRKDFWEYKKVYSGNCYGLINFENGFITIDDNLGMVYLDKEYKVIKSVQLPSGSRGHGVAFSDIDQCFYIASSYKDSVLVVDREFKIRSSIEISNKFQSLGAGQHHCNDICYYNGSLYISMFSYTGNYKRDVFDGVVLEIDVKTQTILNPVVSNLFMPHNIMINSGGLVVLNSLKGEILKYNMQVIGEFPGFTRGLAYDGQYYYVGQSKNRSYSKRIGQSKNISLDASIIVFDEVTKLSRSISLPPKLSDIHSILLIN